MPEDVEVQYVCNTNDIRLTSVQRQVVRFLTQIGISQWEGGV